MSSKIDVLFEELFGFIPKKKGEAYEMLSAAVIKLLYGEEVYHDKRIRGEFSNSLYQIDVLKKDTAGEAKDYTKKGEKVGRGDLQKLGGALLEIDVEDAMFFSATDYTREAKKYANASDKFTKKIDLYHLRPSTKEDESGRLMAIEISLVICTPVYDQSKFTPILTVDGRKESASINQKVIDQGEVKLGDKVKLNLTEIYNSDRSIYCTISDLTSFNYGGEDGITAIGSFYLPKKFIIIFDELIEINGITYNIPFNTREEKIVIEPEGKHKILVKNETGEIDKLITDEELKKIKFVDNEVKISED